METIGNILKNRIKECGYTQEQLADEIGIKRQTLGNYIHGRRKYDYEMLLQFCKKLDCSADYLLGLSASPRLENEIISNELRLSDEAINILQGYAKQYDNDFGKTYIETVNALIISEKVINAMGLYLLMNNEIDKAITSLNNDFGKKIEEKFNIKEETVKSFQVNLETYFLTNLTETLIEARDNIKKSFQKELEKKINKTRKQL